MKKIDIKILKNNITHYQSKGYICNIGDIITINIGDLSPTSKKIERRVCDCNCDNCNCEKEYSRQHNYNVVTFNSYGKDINPICLKLEQFKEYRRSKVESTNLIKYGVKAPLQNKIIQTKQKQTMVEKYGVEYPSQSTEIMAKIKETNLQKYGGTNPMASSQVREKVRVSLYENENVPTSIQQKELKELLSEYFKDEATVILNFPESTTSLDIALLIQDNKIDIEYDGGYWHQDEQKDRRRDEFLKSKGYKILRIRSGHLLPDITQIINSLEYLINQNHSFTEIILADWNNNI